MALSAALETQQERSGPIEGIVEDRLERVAESRIGHQLGALQEPDGRSQKLDPGEWVGLTRQQKHRAGVRSGEPGGWRG
jgi:hypothetical protein